MSGQCWIINELGMGFRDGDERLYEANAPLAPIEKSVKLGLCNGFRRWVKPGPPSMELIDRVIEKAGFMIVSFWIGSRLNEQYIINSGKSEEEYYDYYVQLLKKAGEKYGDRFFWSVVGEPDSVPIGFPKEQLESKKKAREFCVQWVKSTVPGMVPNTKLKWFDYLKTKNVNLKANNNIGIQLGRAFMAHYAFELGVRLVLMECNCGLPEGLQRTVAFTRGAANQFRINKTYWGIDISTWNDRTQLCLQYNEKGQRMGGLTESLYLRELMYIFLAGCNLIHEEISDSSHWINRPEWYS